MRISITWAPIIAGAGKRLNPVPAEITNMNYRKAKNSKDMAEFIENSRFIWVLNHDNFCLVRAVIIGMAYADGEKNWQTLKRANNREVDKRTREMVHQLKLPDTKGGLNLEHVAAIDNSSLLAAHQIVVFSDGLRDKEPVHINRNKSHLKKKIFLMHSRDHFNLIGSIQNYYRSSYYCFECHVPYNELGYHKCAFTCKSCQKQNCEQLFEENCKCGVVMQNPNCRQRHEEMVCYLKRLCSKCQRLIPKHTDKHVCVDQKWCPNCYDGVNMEHMCFMLTEAEFEEIHKNRKKRAFSGFIFFDFESYTSKETGMHVVNLAMVQKVCVKCIDSIERCEKCAQLYIFSNITEFVDWMLEKENADYQFFAHNSSRFDSHFIINELNKRRCPIDKPPMCICKGCKLLGIFYRQISIKDSASFLPMKLEDFSKAFGLTELKKGFFCHHFNLPENQNYIGDYPPKNDYGYEYMPAEKRVQFDKFYDEAIKNQHVKPFNFKEEFYAYCQSDVALLAASCLAFSKMCRESSKIDENDPGFCPLRENLTLASACNHLFRRNFLDKNTIGILPAMGYNPRANSSRGCEEWLKYVSQSEQIHIQHAKNSTSEYYVKPFYLDGICFSNKKIYEFQGFYLKSIYKKSISTKTKLLLNRLFFSWM